jgi:ATP-binding cassette subfamily B protein
MLDKPNGLPLPDLTKGNIQFENVIYSYQEGRRVSLQGVSFEIPLGCHTALIGVSGAGKSTIFSLLLGFILPQSGKVKVNGVPLEEISRTEWLGRIGWVPQFPYLFNDTVITNIRASKPDASEADVIAVARMAQVDDFISSLPEGYQTIVGEKGLRFSGGQAQRIAIARALLLDPSILLLDEPANSLDLENTLAIQSAIDANKAGRTVITISHQLSRIRAADQIILLDEGRVQESGGHDALIAVSGHYRALVQMQGDSL